MKFYSAHIRRHGLNPDRDLVLVKEGFSWPAFMFSILWALWHRLWLAAGVILLASGGLNLLAWAIRPDLATQAALSLGVGVIIGYIGNDLRRSKLTRQGFALGGVVAGKGGDEALRRYLDENPQLAQDLKP